MRVVAERGRELLFAFPSTQCEIVPELAGADRRPGRGRRPQWRPVRSMCKTSCPSASGMFTESNGGRFVLCACQAGWFSHKSCSQRSIFGRPRAGWRGWNWQQDSRNTPPIQIRQFGAKKGDQPHWTDPLTPFPAEVVGCLNTVWERAATHQEQVHDFGIGDALSRCCSTRGRRSMASRCAVFGGW